MDDRTELTRYQRGRETLLIVLLAVLVVGGSIFFLNFVTFGFFGWVVVIALGVMLFGWLNYLLWGRSLDRETARERAEWEAQQQAEEWRAPPPWERRF